MSNILDYTDRAIKTISERIENSLGGNVDAVNDKKEETLTVDWKKNDKTVHAVQFKKVYSYKELEALSDPGALVMDFVTAYTTSKVVESKAVKTVKAVKVEEPVKVEEAKVLKTKK